jgi:hypothetical protein
MLMPAVDTYVAVRRAAGFELQAMEVYLRSFARFATAHGDTHVVAQTVIDWATLTSSEAQRQNSHAPGAPRPMKMGWPYALPEEHDRMRPKGLGVRSCSDWCPEPVTALDLDTCRHHTLSPASYGKSRTQGSLFCAGYPASPLGAWRCEMDVGFTRCAGLDVHKKRITACRMIPDPTGQEAEGIMELRTFGTMTRDLLVLADWLTEASITPVAMASTGEYTPPGILPMVGGIV